MPSLSFRRIIWGIVVGIALLCGATFVWYYAAVVLPAQQSAAQGSRMNVLEAQVRAKACPEASSSTNEALRRLCGAQPSSR